MDTDKKMLYVLTDEISKLPMGEVAKLRDWMDTLLLRESAKPDYAENYRQLLAVKNDLGKQASGSDLAMLDPSLDE